MEYPMTPEQKDLQVMVKDFVKKKLPWEVVRAYDLAGEVPMDIVKLAADMGLTTLTVPERFGGVGQNQLTAAIVTEELAYGDAGFATTMGASELAITPVLLFGSDEQKRYVTDFLLAGKLAAFGLTEAEAGSDAGACKTKARKVGDEYVINGTKSFITNGAIADVYTIFAVTDPTKGAKGISAFIVERDRKGFSVGKDEDKMGIRLSNTTELILEDVHIPQKNLIGEEGLGFKYAMMTLDRTRPASCAACCGICQSAIDQSIAYAKIRKTFGRPIITNQAIQFMLADMEIQTQAARALVWHSARMIDSGVADSMLGACAKTFGGDTAVKVALDAIQIFGGNGYSREYPVEILLRNAKIYQIFEGTNQVQRMIIGGTLVRR